jgi:hypothetical protein
MEAVRRRTRGFAITVTALAVAGALLAQRNTSPVGRDTVARFLQVEPSSLEFRTAVAAPRTDGTDVIRELWVAKAGPTGAPVDVWVDRTLNYVTAAQWGEGAPPEGDVGVGGEDALAAARSWACRAWGDLGAPEWTSEPAGHGDRAPAYRFRWIRQSENGSGQMVWVEVSAVTGEICRYLAVVLPPQPAASQPVLITAAEAASRASAVMEARVDHTVLGVRVGAVKTRSAFAPAGEPVYPVHVEAIFRPPRYARDLASDDYFEVHATTGEVFIGIGRTASNGPSASSASANFAGEGDAHGTPAGGSMNGPS